MRDPAAFESPRQESQPFSKLSPPSVAGHESVSSEAAREQVLGDVKSPKLEVSLSLVKADLKADVGVAGARLAGGTYVELK